MFFAFTSLRSKILVSYLAFVTLLFLIIWLSFSFYQKREQMALTINELNALRSLFLQATRQEKHFYAYDLTDTAFYGSEQCSSLTEYNQLVTSLTNRTASLTQSEDAYRLAINTSLTVLNHSWNEYAKLFNATVNLCLKRGFKDYGQEGKMRDYAHALERTSINKVQLLTLRRYEKDYIIRKDTLYAFHFFCLLQSLQSQYSRDAQVVGLLKHYGESFRNLTLIDAELGLTPLLGKRGKILMMTQQLEKDLDTLIIKAELEAKRIRHELTISFLLIMGGAFVLCIILSFLFSYSITRPVNLLTQQVDQIAASRFESISSPLPVRSKDEVGTLTDHINQMLSQIQLHLEEVQASSELLTQQNGELHQYNQRLTVSELQLRQLNAVKDRFFAIISHDLRGPLVSLQNFMQLYEEDYTLFSVEELQLMKRRSITSINQMINLLDNLLSWALMQIDHIRYVPGKIDLSEVLNKNHELVMQSLEVKKIRFRLVTEDSIKLWADYNMVDFILRNLLSNAIKFTHPEGEVIIKVMADETTANITICDTGIGMDDHMLAKIMSSQDFPIDPVSTLGTLKEKGTGLGLIICQDFVRRNGGVLTFDSAPGKGTTATLKLNRYVKKRVSE
ncbi:HAMP domain-containing sensor histidine kinase [Cytophagaceae bacterium YF14B1]|uniref:histidine kinase n=1 Tax=Xanthocytophaga flava TaxID=3048013 RepID=A0AAE3QT04_9BACT|nr:HAMP domain-containing sensor histidine kinase [Xanthocytophaga flavus]MDJ1482930.1 HAMP domain-containing sensor histidine kinase [Xanthocytophaga flavus]